jgi:predicted outer membrane repeat protein
MSWLFLGGKQYKNRKSLGNRRNTKRSILGRRRPVFEELEQRRVLATFMVTTTADLAAGSLRDALTQANNNPGADIVQFNAGLSGTIALANATELSITDPVTVIGPGRTQVTVDAQGASRILNISDEAVDVTISGLTFTRGNPGAGNSGGAIYSSSLGLLTITDSAVTASTCGVQGGGIFAVGDIKLTNVVVGGAGLLKNTANSGGGIASQGNVTLKDSTISGNTTAGAGGGIFVLGSLSLDNTVVGGTVGNVTTNGLGGGVFAGNVEMLNNSAVSGNTATSLSGGGIFANGSVTMRHSTVSGNTAGAVNDGGGIYALSSVSVLEGSTIGGATIASRNTAGRKGGGIFASSVDVQDSTVSGNAATTNSGGGIYARSTVTLKNSTVSENTAGDLGGGVFSFRNLSIDTCTVVGNTATGGGGGVESGSTTNVKRSTISGNKTTGANGGGGILAAYAVVQNSTITGNEAREGGGIKASFVTLQSVTVAANKANVGGVGTGGGIKAATKFTMQNSIVVGNTDNGTHPDLDVPNNAPGSKVKFSLIGDNTGTGGAGQFQAIGPGGVNGSNNFVGGPASPITVANAFGTGGGTLSDNGGPTQTIALLTGSIAINRGKNILVPDQSHGDQRGSARIVGAAVDMGAFEVQAGNVAPIVANPIPDQTAVVGTAFNFTFAANAFTDPNNDTLTYTATLDNGNPLPAWITTKPNGTNRTFAGTPAANDTTPINIKVTATDPGGLSISDVFTLTITPIPPGPGVNTLLQEDFNGAGVSNLIETQAGSTFNHVNNAFTATRTPNANTVATFNLNALPATGVTVQTTVKMGPTSGTGNNRTFSNAFIVFDYVDANNFKVAGIEAANHLLVVSQFVNGVYTRLASKAGNFTTGVNYALKAVVTQAGVTVSVGSNSLTKTLANNPLIHRVGIATKNAQTVFDDIVVTG